MPSARDLGDAAREQADVVALERPRPHAVVADHPLGAGRVGGGARLEQVGPVGELALQVLGEQHLHHGVHRSDRAGLVPVGIDAHALERPVAHLPEDAEPVELAVRGHVLVEPGQPGGHAVVVLGRRHHPRRGALEHQQLADVGGDLGDELHGAGPGADDRHPLAGQVDVVAPPRRVERGAGERAHPGDLGHVGAVELPDGADDGVDDDGLVALGPPQLDGPALVVVRPRGRLHLGAEADALPQAEGVGAVAEVAVQHRLGGVVERPVVALGERVAEVVVGVVDPAPRIAVLVPGAAHVLVLVDDEEVDARLGEAVPGEEARHAGPDDQHAEVGVGSDLVLAPGGAAPVLAAVGQLLLQQRQVGGDVEAAHGVAHDAEDVGVGRRGRGDAAAVTEGDQRLERQGADGHRLLVGEPARREREQQWIGLQVVAEQRHVARGVGQRGEQRLQLGVGEEAADLLVGAVDQGDLGDERTRRRRGRVGHEADGSVIDGAVTGDTP